MTWTRRSCFCPTWGSGSNGTESSIRKFDSAPVRAWSRLDNHLAVHPRMRRADEVVGARFVERDGFRLALGQHAGVPSRRLRGGRSCSRGVPDVTHVGELDFGTPLHPQAGRSERVFVVIIADPHFIGAVDDGPPRPATVGGGGMGQALNAASAMQAYTLSDRGTWLSFANKALFVIEIEGDSRLINRYDVIELNPQKHTGAKLDAAKALADWLVSPDGQKAIGAYQLGGERLFNPSAATPK
jgi:hypothetical protein